VPSEKRARQRAGRQARLAVLARQQQRRRRIRSVVVVVIIAAIVVGSVYLITRPSKPQLPNTAQGRLEAVWEKAGCPTDPHARVNTLKFSKPPLTISSSSSYQATVKTDVGTFVIALDPKESPVAVNSFVFLAKKGFFTCNVFHRVITGFVDQTGDPTATGSGGPGYKFREAGPPTATPQYPLGAVVLANSNSPATTTPNTNGSQWFIVAGSEGESLPPDYVLFGQVTSGMKVVDAINKGGSTGEAGTPKLYHRILSVKIKETAAT
jgi:peptidyl-prolyl cis-trans isomerase B (cyclophilin B)